MSLNRLHRTASDAAAGGSGSAAHDAAVAATATGVPRRRPARHPAHTLLPLELAPAHQRDNPYILHGYRPTGGFRKSLSSLFRLHNETANVWTHLLGFLLFVGLTLATVQLKPAPLRLGAEALARLEHQLYAYGKGNLLELVQAVGNWESKVVQYGQSSLKYGQSSLGALEERLSSIGRHNLQELSHLSGAVRAAGQSGWQELSSGVGEKLRSYSASASAELAAVEAAVHDALASALEVTWPVTRWPCYVFTAGAMACLLTSATCHLFGCCSPHITALLWRFDYAGIAVLIVASFFPPVFYSFLCSPWTRFFYLATTSLLRLSTLCVTLLEGFQKPQWQPYRAALFVGLGLWGIVPVAHSWLLSGEEVAVSQALALELLMGAIYIAGAVIYATRFPEFLKPGAFDLTFNSHQLFHVAVVVAACVHYKAVRILLAWRDASGGCLPPGLLGAPRPLPTLW